MHDPDVVDTFTLGGVRVVWTSSGGAYRGVERIALYSRDGELLAELGPFARGDASGIFGAIHAALKAATVVQLDQLKRHLPNPRRWRRRFDSRVGD